MHTHADMTSAPCTSEYLKAFGGIPSVLPRTIRAIRNATSLFGARGADELSHVIAALTELILKAPTNAAVLLAAVYEMYSLHVEDNPDLPPHKLTRFLGPDGTIAVLGLSFLNRRLSQVCDADQWGMVSLRMRQQMAIGHLLGERIPSVGGGNGMLVAALPFLAVGAMLATNPSAFAKYRAAFRSNTNMFNSEEEQALFNVTHLDLATAISRALGLSPLISMAFLPHEHLLPRPGKEFDLYAVRRLSEALQISGTSGSPECLVWSKDLPADTLKNIDEPLEEILRNPEVSTWLYATPIEDEGTP